MNQLYTTIKGYVDDFIIALYQNRKISFIYLLGSIPVVLWLGMIVLVGKDSAAELFMKVLQVMAFAIAGIFHFYLLSKKISFYRLRFSGEGIIYTLFLSVTTSIVLLFFYLLTSNNRMAGMAIVSSVAFAFPHVCFQLWSFFKNWKPRQYPVWIMPLSKKNNNDIILPDIIQFRFLLPVRKSDKKQEIFCRTIPADWRLGKTFYSLLKDEDISQIEYADESGNLYGWEFYRFLLNGLIRKRLDPEETIWDNRITKNSIVLIKRVVVEKTVNPPVHTIKYKTFPNNSSSVSHKQLLQFSANNHHAEG